MFKKINFFIVLLIVFLFSIGVVIASEDNTTDLDTLELNQGISLDEAL